jgi:hypothetical protein
MRRIAVAVMAAALALTACGGSGDADVASLEGGSIVPEIDERAEDATGGVDEEQALLAFAACMRESGVPQFPDPTLNPDGSVDFGVSGGNPFADVDNDTAEAAVNACFGELEGVAMVPGGADFDMVEMQDAMVEFAACMRDNGIDFDDPDLSGIVFGEGGLSNPFGDLDSDDPDVRAAIEVCQGVFTGFGTGFGN